MYVGGSSCTCGLGGTSNWRFSFSGTIHHCIHLFCLSFLFPSLPIHVCCYKQTTKPTIPKSTTDFHPLIGRITNSGGSQGELTIGFGEGGTVKNGADTIFAASLAETEAGRRGMCHNVSANGFGTVLGKTHAVCTRKRKANKR